MATAPQLPPEPQPQHRGPAAKPWLWVLVAMLLTAALFFYPGDPPKSAAVLAVAPPTTARPVEISALLDRSLLDHRGQKANLRITVNNRGSSALRQLHLHLLAPGFDFAEHDPLCQSGRPGDPHDLPSNTTCTFVVPLQAAALSGTYGITATIDWQREAPESVTLSLGPITFNDVFGAARWARLGRRLALVIKDLALPLLLLVLSSYYSRQQSEREKRDRDRDAARAAAQEHAEKELEASRHMQQLERDREARKNEVAESEANRVRQLLLQRVMELSQDYYMPIISASVSFHREARKLQKRTHDASAQTALYYALVLSDNFERLRRNKGGLFLQSMQAEYLVTHAWGILKLTLNEVLTKAQMDLAIETNDVLKSLTAFQNHTADFAVAVSGIQAWIDPATAGPRGPFADYAGLLDIIQAVLRHEVNSPFWAYWYVGSSPEKKLAWDFLEQPTVLPNPVALSEGEATSIRYLQEHLKAYCGQPIAAA